METLPPILSVVLPVKAPDPCLLNRALASVAVLGERFPLEVLLVVPEAGLGRRWEEAYPMVRTVEDHPPRGVYGAFNAGVRAARGAFLYFMGGDDILLPGMGPLLERLRGGAPEVCHVAVAAVLDEARGRVAPLRSRYALLFRNWPHQGMVFDRRVFERFQFEPRYRVQGDHHLNLLLASDPGVRVGFHRDLVAFFSRGGISSTERDLAFRADMPGIAGARFGWIWGRVAALRRWAGDLRRPQGRRHG